MKKFRFTLLFTLFLFASLSAQSFYLKPFFGYKTVKMSEVNQEIKNAIKTLQQETGHLLPFPEDFNGNLVWGIQGMYHWNDNYFVQVSTFYYQETVATSTEELTIIPDYYFNFKRKIELFEFNLGIQYFFNYNQWRRTNLYITTGFGLAFGWANSNFQYSEPGNIQEKGIHNQGDFSSDALTAHLGAGLLVRLSSAIFLTGEVGIHIANLGQMDGQIKSSDGQRLPFTTTSRYDFSGLFALAGLAFAIPFFP